MTCSDKQVGKLMKEKHKYTKETAASRAGMDPKTARKYLKANQLPSELKKPRQPSTKAQLFDPHWAEIESFLENAPGLEAKTILGWLIDKCPEQYQDKHLRTLQRKVRRWRALEGPKREVIFRQSLKPGQQSQSDYTVMNSLGITLSGEVFNHLLFHFMLPYSCWETVSICFSESFDSLCTGYEQAVWQLGAVLPEHRTDNLSAATHKLGSRREFNDRWTQVLEHYQVSPSRNNPGQSHENGSVEKSNDLIKKEIAQRLMLRGSKDFSSREAYEAFLVEVVEQRNRGRKEKLIEELSECKPLPQGRWYRPQILSATVSPESLITVETVPYSVPSRLIGQRVEIKLYPDKLEIYYAKHFIEAIVRKKPGETGINYRHVINQLQRKPGAFEGYRFRNDLFPSAVFRGAYDALIQHSPGGGHKLYLAVLQCAGNTSEHEVELAIDLLLSSAMVPTLEQVQLLVKSPDKEVPIVQIDQPDLAQYDLLLSTWGEPNVRH